jgi:hypothetical protein
MVVAQVVAVVPVEALLARAVLLAQVVEPVPVVLQVVEPEQAAEQ